MKKLLGIITVVTFILLPMTAQSAEQDSSQRKELATNSIESHLDGERYITRIEAAISLLEALTAASETSFSTWDDCYIDDGSGGYVFNPGDTTIYPNIFYLSKAICKPTFTDISALDRHSLISLAILQNLQIVSGLGDNTFHPNDCLTYGQAAVLFTLSHHGGQEYINTAKYPQDYIEDISNTWVSLSPGIPSMELKPDGLMLKSEFYNALYHDFIYQVDSAHYTKFPFIMAYKAAS